MKSTEYVLQSRYWSGPDWTFRDGPFRTLRFTRNRQKEFRAEMEAFRKEHPSNEPMPQSRIVKRTIIEKPVR